MNIKERLTKYWENTCVTSVCTRFTNVMQSMNFEKKDKRKKNQSKVFNAYNENGCRATCLAFADSNDTYGTQIFGVICRKSGGDYLIIEYCGERVFEVDFRGVINYNEEQLIKCVEEYSAFFDGIVEWE